MKPQTNCLLLAFCLLAAAQPSPLLAGEWQTIEPGGETRCATGTPYKFHVRRGDVERLMIFFNGGGACWSARDCDVGDAISADSSDRPPKRLFVAGGSAGALASPFYAGVLADHYPQADTVHFAGGSGIYRLGVPTQLWRLWGVFERLPAVYADSGQSAANTSLLDLYRMANEAAPGIAFHQFDHAYDAVQKQGQERLGSPVDPLEALNANRKALHEALPNFVGYTAPGRFHTVLRFEELYKQETSGLSALDWVRRVAEGGPVEEVHCGEPPDCR